MNSRRMTSLGDLAKKIDNVDRQNKESRDWIGKVVDTHIRDSERLADTQKVVEAIKQTMEQTHEKVNGMNTRLDKIDQTMKDFEETQGRLQDKVNGMDRQKRFFWWRNQPIK